MAEPKAGVVEPRGLPNTTAALAAQFAQNRAGNTEATEAAPAQPKLGEQPGEAEEAPDLSQTEAAQAPGPGTEVETPAGTPAGEPEVLPETEEGQPSEAIDGLSEEAQQRINERIGKYAGRAKAAEEALQAASTKLDELETRLREVEAKPAETATQSQGPIPLGEITSEADLVKAERQAEQVLDWTDDLLRTVRRRPEHVEQLLRDSGVKVVGENGVEDYSPESMEDWLSGVRRNADRMLRREAPQRRQFLAAETQYAAEAVKYAPWWNDPKSSEYQNAQKFVRNMPAIKGYPHWKLMVSAQVEGLKVIEGKMAAAETPKPKTPAPKPNVPTPRPSAAPRPVEPAAKRVVEAEQQFVKTGSREDLAKQFAAKRK